MRRFLITTALEATWRDDKPVLFLGEWCRRFSRRAGWMPLEAEVLPYHWDDRRKLYSDYVELLALYERVLPEITEKLNRIHGVNHGLRYWRILAGPWLGYFIQMLFDRWSSIEQAVQRHPSLETVVLAGGEERLIPTDMSDFINLFIGDEWNHHVYSEVLRHFPEVRRIEQRRSRLDEARMTMGQAGGGAKTAMKAAVASILRRISAAFTGERDAFFIATYLPAGDEVRMHRRLGQNAQRWVTVPPPRTAADPSRRDWSLSTSPGESKFESFVRAMIPKQIPTAYLEGYSALVRRAGGVPWPKSPKLVWTSNAFSSDEIFKAWAAEKVERGAPFAVGQHGGHYGMGRWSFVEEHEIAISDRFLSWGWTEPGTSKVTPVGQLKAKRPLGVRHAAQPGALLVTAVAPRYSYFMYSMMISSQWLSYFEDQCAFVEKLPERIRGALTVRLSAEDYGWDEMARWRDRFPRVQLDDGKRPINDLVRASRLYISTYNASSFLESFTMNVPSVVYWNPNHSELRSSAIPYFEELKEAGIFHENPESAARHVAAIWDDIDGWWESPEVRAAVRRFTARYSFLPDDLLGRVEGALREMITSSRAA